MSLAGIGAVAGGLSRGLSLGLDMAGRQEDREYQREQRARQKRLQERADADQAALDAANMDAQNVIKRHQSEWQKAQPGPTLDGGPVQASPFRVTPAMAVEAGRARTDKLLALGGPNEQWAKAWAQDEAMRANLRAGAAQRVKQALVTGADPTGPIGEFFGTIDDGYEVSGVTPTKGPDGKVAFTIARSNRFTGQPADQPIVLSPEQLLKDIDSLAANPVDAAKHSMAMTLEAYKRAGNMEEIAARGEQDRKTAKERHGMTLEEIDRRSAGAKEVAQVRASGSRSSANAEAIRALGQERTSVDNDIRTLTQQLKDARPTDREAIQAQLAEARQRAQDIRRRLADLSAGEGGGTTMQGSKMDAVMRDAEGQGLGSFDVQLDGQPRVSVTRGGAAPAKAASEPDKFQKGRVYTDKDGRKAKYLGDGKWQIL